MVESGPYPDSVTWAAAQAAGARRLPRWGGAWTWAALFMALAVAAPAVIARYPMMTDYPAHLARWYVMINHRTNALLDQYYAFRWAWSGNLGVDILIQPLNALFGIETAGRIFVIAIPVLTGLALVTVSRTLHGRAGPGTVFAMATIWSPALLMGFLNFALSLALALFAFAFWVRARAWRWRAAAFVPISLVVWLCHQSGWGVLGVMVFAYEWRTCGHIRPAVRATFPLWLPFLPTLLAAEQAPAAFGYGPRPIWVKWIEWKTALRDQNAMLDIASLVFFIVAPLLALFARKLDGRLAWAALICALLSLVIPRHLGGGDYADYRLIGVALMLGALAIDWTLPAWLIPVAAMPFMARLWVTTLAWNAHSRDVSAMLHALDHLPRGAKVAYAFEEQMRRWPLAPNGHLGSWATVRRDALTNCHFAIPGVHMLQIKAPGWKWKDPSQRFMVKKSQRVDLSQFAPAKVADYLWYYGKRPPVHMPAGAEVVFRTRHSFLARLRPQDSARIPD